MRCCGVQVGQAGTRHLQIATCSAAVPLTLICYFRKTRFGEKVFMLCRQSRKRTPYRAQSFSHVTCTATAEDYRSFTGDASSKAQNLELNNNERQREWLIREKTQTWDFWSTMYAAHPNHCTSSWLTTVLLI